MSGSILVVDDEEIIRESLSFVLKKEGFRVATAENGKAALEQVKHGDFDIVVTDLEMPEMKGIELLEHIAGLAPETSVMIVTAYGSIETAISALRKGAVDYVLKPVDFDDLLHKIGKLLSGRKIAAENKFLRREINRDYDFSKIIGKSRAMEDVFRTIRKVAGTEGTVLITGKSGTGKELVARAIHFHSARAEGPFLAVNCGAIPENLFESELFGHKKGAFTGAASDRVGFFKAADSGTLFLDEVSEIPTNLQVKLLRVLETREVTPVGTSASVPVDVRILASTNRDLLKEVEEGRFREDLFYRLNVVEVPLPPLSERLDDLPLLVEHFIGKYGKEMSKPVRGVENEVMRMLMAHTWKGEVRELENIIERAVIFAEGKMITREELPAAFGHLDGSTYVFDTNRTLREAVRDFEHQYIGRVLRLHQYNKEVAARALEISLSSLYRKIEELSISLQE
ncbi:MAG: sigma-54 dependent transcriptional regulator [Ignavibacteria bacterium]|nr:sigma-54 dependent transcriptional regulator [Ignavibacteria bacterium]